MKSVHTTYDSSAENQYYNAVDTIDTIPDKIPEAIERVSYVGNEYLYGSESFGVIISSLETAFLNNLDNWYSALLLIPGSNAISLQTLNRLQNRFTRILINDQKNQLQLDWKIASKPRVVDPALTETARRQIVANRRINQFFYECISIQFRSVENVLRVITSYIDQINQQSSEGTQEQENRAEVFFLFNQSIGLEEFEDITKTLRTELIADEFIHKATSLSQIRNLFTHPDRRIITEQMTLVKWLKPYITLADLVKQLKAKSIIVNEQSVYQIAVKRFVSKSGLPFAPKKERPDNRPNKDDRDKIDNLIALISRSTTDG
jgi:hypothetical protein